MTALARKKLITEVSGTTFDFEWYPTTNEMLDVVKADIEETFRLKSDKVSILDCGAGDGKALNYLTEGKKYAIEKSAPLVKAMNSDIFIIGADFYEQSLLTTEVDVIFSNPPYSDFVNWVCKIIQEAYTECLYFVIPERWKNNETIKAAIKARKGKETVLGAFDFMDAERKARAKVNIVKIALSEWRGHKSDPFETWFKTFFKLDLDSKPTEELFASSKNKEQLHNEVIKTNDVVDSLVTFYNRELDDILSTYRTLEQIDRTVFNELDINLDHVLECLKIKFSSLKSIYWQELLSNTENVKKQLTSESRQQLFNTLNEHTGVDFNQGNIRNVLIWILKNANNYIDSQLVSVVESIVTSANITGYKSNQRTFGEEKWRYSSCASNKKPTHYQLDYRFVVERYRAMMTDDDYNYQHKNYLENSCVDLINDLRTIAYTLGYDISKDNGAESRLWQAGKYQNFYFEVQGKKEVLFKVKAHLNGNLHFQFNQKFMCKLNVEFGRLKGWLKSKPQAATELNIKEADIDLTFNTLLQFDLDDATKKLGLSI